jgi:hypothetical protein
MAWISGRVKAIKSGDTLTLVSPKSNAEKDFSFAYISAPRLRREGDEVCFLYLPYDYGLRADLPSA